MTSDQFCLPYRKHDPDWLPDLIGFGFTRFESRESGYIVVVFERAVDATHAALVAHEFRPADELALLLPDDENLKLSLEAILEDSIPCVLFRLVEIGAEPTELERIRRHVNRLPLEPNC